MDWIEDDIPTKGRLLTIEGLPSVLYFAHDGSPNHPEPFWTVFLNINGFRMKANTYMYIPTLELAKEKASHLLWL